MCLRLFSVNGRRKQGLDFVEVEWMEESVPSVGVSGLFTYDAIWI
jgi:hypothetical protein